MVKFADPAYVKAMTPIGATYTDLDKRIEDLIPAVSKAIQDYCRRQFTKAARTEYFSTITICDGSPYHVWVKEPPILTPAPVIKIAFNYDWANTDALESEFYEVNNETGKITFFNYNFPTHPRGIRIDYTGGYDAVEDQNDTELIAVPEAVRQALGLHIHFILKRELDRQLGDSDKSGKSGAAVRVDQRSITGLVAEARGYLASFRKPLLGNG
jgi:hypothetical protein